MTDFRIQNFEVFALNKNGLQHQIYFGQYILIVFRSHLITLFGQ